MRSGGPGSGIWKSTDGGTTWNELGRGDDGFPDLVGKMSVSVSANHDRVYALVEADPGGGLYGYWRGFVDSVVARYLDCGVAEAGFANFDATPVVQNDC